MKCEYCGSEISSDTRICKVCGSPVSMSGATIYAGSENFQNPSPSLSLQKNAEPSVSAQNYSVAQNNVFQPQQNPAQNFSQQQFNQTPVNGGFDVQPVAPNLQQTNNFNQQPQQFQNGQQGGFGQQPIPGGGYNQPILPVQPNLTKKDFAQIPQLADWKKNFKITYIVGYICAGLMLISTFIVGPYALIDLAIVLGTTLGIHLKYSYGCAIGLLVYAIINTILGIVMTGSFSGWLILATAICAVRYMSAFEKYWKDYQSTGSVPTVIPKW